MTVSVRITVNFFMFACFLGDKDCFTNFRQASEVNRADCGGCSDGAKAVFLAGLPRLLV